MNHDSHDPGSPALPPAERFREQDFDSLRRTALRGLPSIDETARALERRRGSSTREGFLMKTLQTLKMRPWLTTATGVAVIATLLLAVPISYTRTIGYEVSLGLVNVQELAQGQKIGSELGKAIGAENVSVSSNRAAGTSVIARVPSRSRAFVQGTADAFAADLTRRGIPATAEVRRLTEKISTNLYAYAEDRVFEIRVNREGKTPAQIEQEVREQLEAAGFGDATVSVSQDGERTEIHIQRTNQEGSGESIDPQITIEGAPPENQKRIELRLHGDHPMTDEELRVEAERQLREQGVEADVEIVNGEVRIHPR